MENEFHIGKNGPAPCPAKIKCRLDSEHYSTQKEAQEAYETQMSDKTTSTLSKNNKDETPEKIYTIISGEDRHHSEHSHHQTLDSIKNSIKSEYAWHYNIDEDSPEYTELEREIDSTRNYAQVQKIIDNHDPDHLIQIEEQTLEPNVSTDEVYGYLMGEDSEVIIIHGKEELRERISEELDDYQEDDQLQHEIHQATTIEDFQKLLEHPNNHFGVSVEKI